MKFAATQFPAAVTLQKRAGDLTLSETRYGSHAILGRHSHENACLVVVIDGTFEDRCGGDRRVAPGDVIFRPAGEPHSNRFIAGGARCLNIELSDRWLNDNAATFDRPMVFSGGKFALAGFRLHRELRRDDDSGLAIESLVSEMAGMEVRDRRVPKWIECARELIDCRPNEAWTLRSVASEVGVHPVYLATSFRRWCGQTVGEYLRQARIAAACRQLAMSDAPIADIALAAGFADQSHFGRIFKRLVQTTPRRFRIESH